ncbi:MAG: TRAP transporter large permease [Clostridia bacterium]|nr:TRAP transporter large permease [Clostridia bacterium]
MTIIEIMIIFVVCLFIAIPVSISLGIASVIPGAFDSSFTASATYVVRSMVSGIDSFPLLAIPMFVLSGIIMAKGGVSKKLFDVFSYFIGKRRAGIPCAVIITCLFYGAISGSAPATVAAVGSMTIPILITLGYDKTFSTAIVAVAGGLGVIIPPSIPYILFAMASGESVSDLFLAGIIPGVLIAVLLMGYAYYYCRRYGEDKEKINLEVDRLHKKGLWKVMKESVWALLTPVIILGCIYGGIASPTEAAVISVFYALFVSMVIYRSIKFKDIYGILVEACRTFAPLLFILVASNAFSRVLTLMQVPQMVSAWILESFSGKIVILPIINLFLLVVGMVMDTSPAILITTPILLPIIVGAGVDPVHFGIIMVINLAIGFVTPPIGVNLFVASSLADIPVMKIAKKALPMIIFFLIALLLITFIPQISMTLLGGA